MSPNPRREKGRSHRANGEVFSLGTFRTMGSCGEEAAPADPASHHPPRATGPEHTFSCVAESVGPVATSTMMLFPL